MNAEEAAAKLGCKAGLIYKLCAEGRLGHLRIGFGRGHVVIEENHLEEYRRNAEVLPLPIADEPVERQRPRGRTGRAIVRDFVGEYERQRKARTRNRTAG